MCGEYSGNGTFFTDGLDDLGFGHYDEDGMFVDPRDYIIRELQVRVEEMAEILEEALYE